MSALGGCYLCGADPDQDCMAGEEMLRFYNTGCPRTVEYWRARNPYLNGGTDIDASQGQNREPGAGRG